ncbi:MAG: hypothetical protein R2685_08060 [Candidatus Nitrosocosmicus sp.]|nr:hypothetical protein [Candidatus Nitrosocosmicus sp.]
MSNTTSSSVKHQETIDISKTDLEIRNDTLANEIVNESDKAMNQKLKIKTLVLEYADNLEQMVERKLVPWSKEMIFSIILNNLKIKGISYVGEQYVYGAFNYPEYNKFKYFRNHGWNQQQKQQGQQQDKEDDNNKKQIPTTTTTKTKTVTAEQNNKFVDIEKAVISSRVNDALLTLEQNLDHPAVIERLEKHYLRIDKERKKAKQQERDLAKICMEKPKPRESTLQELLLQLEKICPVAATNVFNYPPDPKDDLYFKQAVSIIIEWVQSLADRKWSRSIFSWIDIQLERTEQSTHSAMSKSKIFCRSDILQELNEMQRKVTREQIDAKHPVIIGMAKRLTEMAEFVLGGPWAIIKEVFAELIEQEHPLVLTIASRIVQRCPPLIAMAYYKDTYQAPWNAGFHVMRHDKLSESAFGNSTMQQHGDDEQEQSQTV